MPCVSTKLKKSSFLSAAVSICLIYNGCGFVNMGGPQSSGDTDDRSITGGIYDFSVSGPTTVNTGGCYEYKVKNSKDGENLSVETVAPFSLTSTSDGETESSDKIEIYRDSSCTDKISQEGIAFSPGESEKIFYLKATSTGDYGVLAAYISPQAKKSVDKMQASFSPANERFLTGSTSPSISTNSTNSQGTHYYMPPPQVSYNSFFSLGPVLIDYSYVYSWLYYFLVMNRYIAYNQQDSKSKSGVVAAVYGIRVNDAGSPPPIPSGPSPFCPIPTLDRTATITGPSNSNVGQCRRYNLQLSALDGQPTNASVDRQFSISFPFEDVDGVFLASDCTGVGQNSVTIKRGFHSVAFSVRFTEGAGNQTIAIQATESMGNIPVVTQNVNVGNSTVTSVDLSGSTQPVINSCAAYTVSAKNFGSQIVNANGAFFVSVNATNGGALFYADPLCLNSDDTFQMKPGNSRIVFYAKIQSIAQFDIFAIPVNGSGSPIGSIQSDSVRINALSNPYYLLRMTGPIQIPVGTCSHTFTAHATRNDGTQTPVPLPEGTSVHLGVVGNARIYSDSNCVNPVSSLPFNMDKSSATFYIRANTEGQMRVLLSNTPDYSGSSIRHSNTTTANSSYVEQSVTRLSISSGSYTPLAGNCEGYQVTLMSPVNTNGVQELPTNTLVALSGNGTGTFYSNMTCTDALDDNMMTIPAGQHFQNFYFKGVTVQTTNLRAQAPGLADGVRNTVNVDAGAPYRFTLAFEPAKKGTCQGITVGMDSRSGKSVQNNDNTPGQISLNASIGQFYSDIICTVPLVEFTLKGDMNGVTLYYKFDSVEDRNVLATVTDLESVILSNQPGPIEFESGIPKRVAPRVSYNPVRSGFCRALVVGNASFSTVNGTTVNTFDDRIFSITSEGGYLSIDNKFLGASNLLDVTLEGNHSGKVIYSQKFALGDFSVQMLSPSLTSLEVGQIVTGGPQLYVYGALETDYVVDFGIQNVGGNYQLPFNVVNVGTSPASLFSYAAGSTWGYSFNLTPCTTLIQAQESCGTGSVNFTPGGVGNYNRSPSFSYLNALNLSSYTSPFFIRGRAN